MIDEAIQAFRDGRLQIRCKEVRFTPRSSTKPSYAGPGAIKQTPEGRIVVECEPERMVPSGIPPGTSHSIRIGVPGTFYRDEDHYDCEATEESGRVWKAHRFLLPESELWPLCPTSVSADVGSVVNVSEARSEQSRIRIEFFKQDADHWQRLYNAVHTISGHRLKFNLFVEPVGESIAVTAAADGPLVASFSRRLIEALQFVLDLTLEIDISDCSDGIQRIVEFYGTSQRGTFVVSYPPITASVYSYRESVSRLLSGYLDYIIGYHYLDEKDSHPCSNFLSLARRSSGVSFDAWALSTVVAGEGIADFLGSREAPIEAGLSRALGDMLNYVNSASWDQGIKDRIIGSFSKFGRLRANDLMKLLAGSYLRQSDIDAWKKLRDSSVHEPDMLDHSTKITRLENKYRRVLASYCVMHGMIFHLIGYKGERVDYAALGFPVGHVPLSA